jgi:DNA-binding beta-propeller fold protein YncE
MRLSPAPRWVVVSLLAALLLTAARDTRAELRWPRGFTTQVYVTGEGFETALAARAFGVPAASTLAFDAAGALYVSRTGRRYFGGEVDDLFSVYRIPLGGARLTPQTEARYLYGPPLPNPQVGVVRNAHELFVTTFDRERKIGVLYRLIDGRADLIAGGTPDAAGVAPLLRQPEGSAVDSAGRLYVADRDQGAIVKLDASGRVLDRVWFPVTRPRVLAIDGHDRVWVGADGPAEAPWQRGPGDVWLVGPDGQATLLLRGPVPSGIALSPAGHLFIADRQGAKIRFLTAEGKTGDVATFTGGDAPRALVFAPTTPATRHAGIAGELFLVTIRAGTWRLNDVLRVSGPFDELVRQRTGP